MQTQPVPISPTQRLRLQAQLLNAVDQSVIATDLDGHVVFWNRFAETLYGWTEQEVLGGDIMKITPAATGLNQAAEVMESLRRGKSWAGERALQRRDGTTFTGYVTASPVYDDEGTLLGIVGLSRDISDEKRHQEAQRRMAQADLLLLSAADYEEPLSTLAELAVPQLADWCAVHLLQADGSIEQVTSDAEQAAQPPAASEWLHEQLSTDETEGVAAVVRTGEPKLVPEVGPADGAMVKSYMIVPLMARPRTLGAITFVAAESGRHYDDEALSLAENLAGHVAIYLDKAREYRESQRAKEELERIVAERTAELAAATEQLKESETTLQSLFRITKKLNSTLDIDTLMDELALEAIAIVNGESGFAGLRTADGVSVLKFFRRGVAEPFEYTWRAGNGVPGWVLGNKIPYGTSDAATDPLVLHELLINEGISSIICTPILDSAGEVLGFFDIRNKLDGSGFTIADQDMLMDLAPSASIAIQNALAYQERLENVKELKKSSGQLHALAANLESAREQERTEIARELHDQLGQSLTAMKFDLAWLTDGLAKKNSTLAFTDKVKTLRAQMDGMINTVRRLAMELRPGMLDDLGLAASIEWQTRDFEKRTGIACVVNITAEDLPVARTQSLAMFRIFQEALTNVARHARAKKVEIILSCAAETLILRVHDDGRGINTQELNGTRSLGLIGMRERAQRLGGSFDIEAGWSGGTTVTVCIPVKQEQ